MIPKYLHLSLLLALPAFVHGAEQLRQSQLETIFCMEKQNTPVEVMDLIVQKMHALSKKNLVKVRVRELNANHSLKKEYIHTVAWDNNSKITYGQLAEHLKKHFGKNTNLLAINVDNFYINTSDERENAPYHLDAVIPHR